jgi:ribonucleotide monophosphatase NagD (HAD superfamily)
LAGKPFDPMVRLVHERVGRVTTLVGDRASTDGLMAQRLGARFALVLSGVTSADDLPVNPAPDVVADSLADLIPE